MPTSDSPLQGCRVAAFESRRSDDLARLIERLGGQAFVSPSMRESQVDDPRPMVEFAHRLVAGEIDVLVLLTGVGTRMLVERTERYLERQRLLDAIADMTTVVRGPKPAAVLAEWGIKPTHRVPEPNTWRELLTTLDARVPIANLTVGLQEYGVTNASLVAGLEARGAIVDRVQVYQWALPEDIAPLEANLRRIVAGEVDALLFTSANQFRNVLLVAERLGITDALLVAGRKLVVGSIGPTCSEALADCDLPPTFEASPPKMGHLVTGLATALRARKHLGPVCSVERAPARDLPQHPSHDSVLLRAARREAVPYTPIWLMRQAGRYMAEYRAVRSQTSFLELCRNPKLASEVMCTAVDYLGVDAAILFSDLLPMLEPMGFRLEFTAGDGPVIHNPVREGRDLARVRTIESAAEVQFVADAVRQTRADLPERLPLIGFAGAPFTLASYAIEGGSSRNYAHTKSLMYRDAGAWHELMQRLSDSVAVYLRAQIDAGAQAVQLFDSWIGCLSPADYREYVSPHVSRLIGQIPRTTPVIHFGTGNPELLPEFAAAGGDVIGVDWRIGIDVAWQRVGYDRAVQGNLDPTVLLADRDTLHARTSEVLRQANGRAGHIFNLGHGILPQTSPEQAKRLVQLVHELSLR